MAERFLLERVAVIRREIQSRAGGVGGERAAVFGGGVLARAAVELGGGAVALAALLFSVDAVAADRDLNNSARAAVIAETIARKSPGTNGDPAFDQPLKDGAEFTLIERRGEWVFGHFQGIGDAWLPGKNVAE